MHRLGIIQCIVHSSVLPTLNAETQRSLGANIRIASLNNFSYFHLFFFIEDFLLLFAAAATLRGRLLTVFPAVVDSSPSSFSIIPGQTVERVEGE